MSNRLYTTGSKVSSADEHVHIVGGRRNNSGTARVAADDEVCELSVDNTGRLLVSLDSGSASAGIHAEDAVHSNGHNGIQVLGVRNDLLATTRTSTNGDYSSLSVDSLGAVFVNTAPGEVKRAFVNLAASTTDGSIVAAVATKSIRILSAFLLCGATPTTVTFKSKPAGASSAISPDLQAGQNGGLVLPFNQSGWFQTVAGEGLTATSGAGSTVGILVNYIEA